MFASYVKILYLMESLSYLRHQLGTPDFWRYKIIKVSNKSLGYISLTLSIYLRLSAYIWIMLYSAVQYLYVYIFCVLGLCILHHIDMYIPGFVW